MGCGSSQQTQQVVETTEQPSEKQSSTKIKSASRVYPSSGLIRVESASKSKASTDEAGSTNDSAVTSRNSSAVSNSSAKSADSGLGAGKENPLNLELDDGKSDVKSTPANLFVNRGPSGKMRSLDEAEIIEKLRNEGLISRPKSVANGMAFEINTTTDEPSTLPPRRLPPRLQRLENLSEEKKAMTEEDIKKLADQVAAKLQKAAERRKKKREARAQALPPRAPTRSGTRVDLSEEPAAAELPIVRTQHPESEVLKPPSELSPGKFSYRATSGNANENTDVNLDALSLPAIETH